MPCTTPNCRLPHLQGTSYASIAGGGVILLGHIVQRIGVVLIAIAIFRDGNPVRIFPRWVAYYNICAAFTMATTSFRGSRLRSEIPGCVNLFGYHWHGAAWPQGSQFGAAVAQHIWP